MKEECRLCRFWEQDGENSYGVCRRFPPVPVHSSITQHVKDDDAEIGLMWEFPLVDAECYCGEFMANEIFRVSEMLEKKS